MQLCWGRWAAEALVTLELQPLQVKCGMHDAFAYEQYLETSCIVVLNQLQGLYNVDVTANNMFGYTLGRELTDVAVSLNLLRCNKVVALYCCRLGSGNNVMLS